MAWIAVGVALLVTFSYLAGHSRETYRVRSLLRRAATERRELEEQWRELEKDRRELEEEKAEGRRRWHR